MYLLHPCMRKYTTKFPFNPNMIDNLTDTQKHLSYTITHPICDGLICVLTLIVLVLIKSYFFTLFSAKIEFPINIHLDL